MIQGLNFGSVMQGFDSDYEDEDFTEDSREVEGLSEDEELEDFSAMEPNIHELVYGIKRRKYEVAEAPYIVSFSMLDANGFMTTYTVKGHEEPVIEDIDIDEGLNKTEYDETTEINYGYTREDEEPEDYGDNEDSDYDDEDYDEDSYEDSEPDDEEYELDDDDYDNEDGGDEESDEIEDDFDEEDANMPAISIAQPVKVEVAQPVVYSSPKVAVVQAVTVPSNEEKQRLVEKAQQAQVVVSTKGSGSTVKAQEHSLVDAGSKVAEKGTQESLQEYLLMKPEHLKQVVRSFMEAKGVARAPIPVEVLEAKFGKSIIDQLIKKSFLVVFKFDGRIVATMSI